MSKPKSPITAKRWNPKLPPKEALTFEVMGEPITFDYLRDLVIRDGPTTVQTQCYIGYGFALLVSIDNTIHGRLLHFSVTGQEELPPWDLLVAIKRTLFPPDVAAVMHLPEESSYVNLTDALHVYQLPVQWGTQ